jgi:hypothetical protein
MHYYFGANSNLNILYVISYVVILLYVLQVSSLIGSLVFSRWIFCDSLLCHWGVIPRSFQNQIRENRRISQILDPSGIFEKRKRLAGTKVTLLATNDLHSAVEGSAGNTNVGHFARLGAMIKEERKKRTANGEIVVTADSGDWFGGSIYDALGPAAVPRAESAVPGADQAAPGSPSAQPASTLESTLPNKGEFSSSRSPEMEFFSFFDYDVITLGNHDFDETEEGLQILLEKGRKIAAGNGSELKFPKIVQSDILPPEENGAAGYPGAGRSNSSSPEPSNRATSTASAFYNDLTQRHAILEYTVTADEGSETLRIGVIGFFGPDSCMWSNHQRPTVRMAACKTNPGSDGPKADTAALFELAERTVAELRARPDADIISGAHLDSRGDADSEIDADSDYWRTARGNGAGSDINAGKTHRGNSDSGNCDIIVALYHGGDSQDRILQSVPGIDVVLEAHTHET